MNYEKKARIDYTNGWKIIIPKGNAASLFLEWLAEFSDTKFVNLVILNDRENNSFIITLTASAAFISDAKNYINSNL